MGLSLTIREDHEICAISIGALEIAGVRRAVWPFPLLAFLRWTSHAYPHGRRVFRRDYWPYNVRLGSGERLYIERRKTFDDNSREWPELTTGKELRFLLPPGIQALGGSGLFCGVFTLFIAPRDVVNLGIGLIVMVILLSPVLTWCMLRLVFCARSTGLIRIPKCSDEG